MATTANIGMKTMSNTPVSDRIMRWIMEGADSNAWFEKNQKEFIRKYQPKIYEQLYVNTRNNKSGDQHRDC